MAVFRLTAGNPETERRFCIPIVKKVAHTTEESGALVGGVASDLNHPLGGGMFGQTGETDAARFQMNEE